MSRTAFDEVEQVFLSELRKLHERMAWPKYKATRLSLHVNYSLDKSRIELEWYAAYDDRVTGADIGTLMDEVYRRLGYNDRAEGAITAKTRALAPPVVVTDDAPVAF